MFPVIEIYVGVYLNIFTPTSIPWHCVFMNGDQLIFVHVLEDLPVMFFLPAFRKLGVNN